MPYHRPPRHGICNKTAGCIRNATPRFPSLSGSVLLRYFDNPLYAWEYIQRAVLEQTEHVAHCAENPQVSRHLPRKCCITLRPVLHGVYGERFSVNIHENITACIETCQEHVCELSYEREVYKGRDCPCNTTSSETVAFPETGWYRKSATNRGCQRVRIWFRHIASILAYYFG